jgi:hypothetical protein
MNKCNCGGDIPQRHNSTIQPKFCPKCALANLYKKAKEGAKDQHRGTISGKTSIYSTVKKKSSKTRKTNFMEIADTWFSRWVRITHGIVVDGEVYSKDIITGKYYRAKLIDCGHYHSRYFNGTRYEPDNARPQNRSSNRFRGEADKPKFEQNLIREIGEERFQQLAVKSKSNGKYGDYELKGIADTYRELVKELLTVKNAQKWW